MTTSRLTPDLAVLLRAVLGESNSVLPFAEAVVAHLTTSLVAQSPPEEIVARVTAMLEAASEDPDDPELAATLAASPELLASFFQNADLLDPSDPETEGLAHLVLESLERLGGSIE